jgi:hypothetical protein
MIAVLSVAASGYIRRTPSHTFQGWSGKEIFGSGDMGEGLRKQNE